MPATHIPPEQWTGRDDSEDGGRARRIYQYAGDSGDRALLGFASEAGVARNKGRVGARQGPQALRKALAGFAAPTNAQPFADLGDVDVEGDDLEAGQTMLGQHIARALGQHDRVIVLGGGHETAWGSYQGLRAHFAEKRIGIINLDAHLDLREPGAAGPSSGTPFNQMRHADPDGFDYLCIGLAEESNTVALFDRAADWGVHMVMDHALIADHTAADAEIAAIAQRSDILYLTIDIDLLPHYQAPGVSAPAARGVPLSTVEHLVETVMTAADAHGCALPLADIVELSPAHDRDGMTARSAALLVRRLLCA
ncbi:formimidoylglutamase [Parasphingopyxis lamellibrachiae]|uniref:Formimidoylglutamase n=1 Tax=Parasphingopyxis lamellibrachiae TaxID=680125 RepID=A0A3D9FIZ5_9SPHN|nr:formimidoylglutamase [Parasphingopyxis lamellibrachiae]RED17774.1 formiminoglutamase [Parasphingopyxis lamellibrachiae]